MDKILIIGANKYSFEDGGRTVRGISCHYLETYDQADPNKRGLVPMKSPCSEEVFAALTQAPVLVEADFGRRPGKGGKAETFIRGIKVLKPFNLLGAAT